MKSGRSTDQKAEHSPADVSTSVSSASWSLIVGMPWRAHETSAPTTGTLARKDLVGTSKPTFPVILRSEDDARRD
jgi:hypothetical protein